MTNKRRAVILVALSVLVLAVAFGASLLEGQDSVTGGVGGSKNLVELKDSYTVGFEGDFTVLNYSLTYSPAIFRVANLPNKSEIKIKDLRTGNISKIGIFYNGAAGFSGVKDFFENVPLGESSSDRYDVVNLGVKMFGRQADGGYEGSAGDKVAIFKNEIGFVYIEAKEFTEELLRVLESFSLSTGEKTSVMPAGIAIKVYFLNDEIMKGNNCDEVVPAERMVFDTKNLAEASLRLLLEGPNVGEADGGYVSSIPRGVWLNSIKIEDGVARADFSKELSATAGSCNIAAIKTQIEKTLLQFETVKGVRISVEGKTEGILEP